MTQFKIMNLIKKIRLEHILGGSPDSFRMYLLELSSQGCKARLYPKILDSQVILRGEPQITGYFTDVCT